MKDTSGIAVVGMSCIFPGAADINQYWSNITNKVSAIQEAPPNRIDKVYFDANSKEVDRLYVTRGGFIDDYVDFNPVEFGIVPNTVKGTEPDQLLSLKLTHKALEDAGVFDKNISLEKAGIIIGRGNYGGVEMAKLSEMIMGGDALIKTLKYIYPNISNEDLLKAKKQYHLLRGDFSADNVMGTVPNLVASLVANRFNFGGPAYTVDAACASSLITIDHAVKEIESGRCDIVVSGAIHLSQNPILWSIFSMMGAFSRSQVVRPFDKRADGVLPGEGCGFVVLRKLEDAIKDDQKIYAVIRGVGLSSDGSNASLMSPSTKGQIKAVNYAWKQAGLSPEKIGYIEAHGTATPLGDKTELETMRQAFGKNNALPRAGIGSVKSMIGHAMPAAGMAGFIKTALALHHDTIPPTLHSEEPLSDLKDTRFELVNNAKNWSETGLPKIAGVNAFGFGGANAHVVLEAFDTPKKDNPQHTVPKKEMILLARDSNAALKKALLDEEYSLGSGSYRLALFNPTPKRIAKAIKIIDKGVSWRGRLQLWYTNDPLLENKNNKLAIIFPGLDSVGVSSLKNSEFQKVASYFKLKKPKYVNHSEGIEVLLGVDEASRVSYKAIEKLNITPDIVTGHSLGEWGACYASGMVSDDTVEILENQAISRLDKPNKGVFLSVGCSVEEASIFLKKETNIYIANDNCPHQIILCGTKKHINNLKVKLKELQIMNYTLPFQTGYHTPFAAEYLDQVKHNLDNIVHFKKAQIPVWSCITAAPYPKNSKDIKQLHTDFITSPVKFTSLISNLYDDGVRFFLQVGAGATSGFIQDILKGKNISVVSSATNKNSALEQLEHVVASLFVEGKSVDTSFLQLKKSVKKSSPKINLSKKLELGLSPILLEDILKAADIEKPTTYHQQNNSGQIQNEILNQFDRNLKNIQKTQQQLTALLNSEKTVSYQDTNHQKVEFPIIYKNDKAFTKKIQFSIENYPELKDHCPFKRRSTITKFTDDKIPIVPLTLFIQLLCDTVREIYPNKVISKIENIKIYQFFWVKETTDIDIIGQWTSENTVTLKVEKYLYAEITVIDKISTSNTALSYNIGKQYPLPLTADSVYSASQMFHGPAYQGVTELSGIGDKGIEGILIGGKKKGKGALLDNIGQLIALWYQLEKINYIPFPVKVDEIEFYDDLFDQEGEFKCVCQYRKSIDDFLISDIFLEKNGKKWAKVTGWYNRKSELDKHLWEVSLNAEHKELSKELIPGINLMEKKYKRMNSWFIILTLYLNKAEQDIHDTLSVARKSSWLLGRIAVKDALKIAFRKKYNKNLHPASIPIISEKSGQPKVDLEGMDNVGISIAHKGDLAVAKVNLNGNVGVDIEEIKDRGASFLTMVLKTEEIALLPSLENMPEWITRCWVAKEAYGKYIGKGLQGNPKNYEIEKIENNFFWIKGIQIETIIHEKYIIGWTTT